MVLQHNYLYFKKAISSKTCQKILEAGRKRITKQGSIDEGMDKIKRDCKIAWIEESWIYDIINPFINTANKRAGWNFQWDWNEASQFTIYDKGHYYGWHADQSVELLKHKSKNINGKTRKLSLTLQLTDKTKYEGGDLQFKCIRDKKDSIDVQTIDGAKELGTIIIFPSFIWHQVLPVTEGKRESLVNWSIGHQFK